MRDAGGDSGKCVWGGWKCLAGTHVSKGTIEKPLARPPISPNQERAIRHPPFTIQQQHQHQHQHQLRNQHQHRHQRQHRHSLRIQVSLTCLWFSLSPTLFSHTTCLPTARRPPSALLLLLLLARRLKGIAMLGPRSSLYGSRINTATATAHGPRWRRLGIHVSLVWE
jgi:hypothetical protein